MAVSDPLVSIVLPTYNGARHLAEAIQSCIDQTWPHWELIVVDDGSTDETPSLIGQAAARDARIKWVRHERNRKLPAALNTGLAQARGELLGWTSDDNRYRPQALERMVHVMSTSPDVEIVYSDVTLVDQDGATERRRRAAEADELPFWNAVGACFLFRREVYECLGGYDEHLFLAEDFDFWLRAYGQFRFHALHEDLYWYRTHDRSLSSLHNRQVKVATRELLERCLREMNWDRQARCLAYLRLARDAAALKERRSAWSYFLSSLAHAAFAGPVLRHGSIVLAHLILGARAFDLVKRVLRAVGSTLGGRTW